MRVACACAFFLCRVCVSCPFSGIVRLALRCICFVVVIFVIIVVRLGPLPLAGLPVRFSCCAFKQVIKTFQKRLIAFFNAFMPFLPQIPDPFVLLSPFFPRAPRGWSPATCCWSSGTRQRSRSGCLATRVSGKTYRRVYVFGTQESTKQYVINTASYHY